jgi:hypothetical protein
MQYTRPFSGEVPMTNASTAPVPGGVKKCVYCGEDCSKKPRQRDAQGRYACNECVERQRSAQAVPVESAAGDDAPADIDLTPVEVDAEVPAFDVETIPIEPEIAPPPRLPPRPAPPALATCPQCGYVLGGLRVPRCPECGTTVTKESVREMRLEKDRAATERAFWLKPLLMFTIGALIMSAIWYADEGVIGLGVYWLYFSSSFVVGVAIFWLCSHIWIGFDEPFRWVSFRIAGIYAVMDVVWYLSGFVPIPIVPALVAVAIYVHLLMSELEIDLQDAMIVGVVTFIAKIALLLGIAAWLVTK